MNVDDSPTTPVEESPTASEQAALAKGQHSSRKWIVFVLAVCLTFVCTLIVITSVLINFNGTVPAIPLFAIFAPDTPDGIPVDAEFAEPPAGWTTVMVDTFEDNTYGWPVESFDTGDSTVTWEIGGGQYAWLSEVGESATWWAYPQAGADQGDLYVSVEAEFRAGAPEETSYGLLFRQIDNDHYYGFLINEAYYAVHANLGAGKWVELIPWTWSELLENPNPKLTVYASGGDFIFLIDDRRVGEIYDTRYGTGNVGLILTHFDPENPVAVHFDNFNLYTP